jgi:hypothetical protein
MPLNHTRVLAMAMIFPRVDLDLALSDNFFAKTIARITRNFIFVSFPSTTGIEDESTKKNHRYRPNLFH